MHINCILDSVANLLVRLIVFVENAQKSPIASHFKCLDPSLDFYCQYPALTGITEGEYVCISLTLEASEMFLYLHMIFSLERTAVDWVSWKESRVLILC